MAKSSKIKSVSKEMQEKYDQIIILTDGFCNKYLNEEYRKMAQYMAAALCRKRPSPIATGKPLVWACSIIYALGQINFLSDPSGPVCMRLADVCSAFNVGQSTASTKSKIIIEKLKANRIAPDWILPSRVDSNPMKFLAELGSLIKLAHRRSLKT